MPPAPQQNAWRNQASWSVFAGKPKQNSASEVAAEEKLIVQTYDSSSSDSHSTSRMPQAPRAKRNSVLYADWDGCAFRRLPALCKHETRDSQTCRREDQTNLSDLVSGVPSIPILEWGLGFEHHSKLSSGLSRFFSSPPSSFPRIFNPPFKHGNFNSPLQPLNVHQSSWR